ncbi:acyltransferase [Granulicella sp. dw_53]|uniref:acyltransferase family protein n=1 Tax=Granulicella sp. dw_53 TaxID=2719792 RepID=UPI001BD4BC9E|nr:acyltransferase [Granulicella sp. dw_53]
MTAGILVQEPQHLRSEQPHPSVPASARKPSLPALTGIRTLLAIFIILFHFTPPHLGVLYPIIDSAYVFVGFFFLLSGFILTYNYSDRALTLSKREFWLARFSRLYPIYLLVLLISVHMLRDEWASRSHAEFWRGVLLTPFLLQGWSPNLATFGNTVAWTLSCEVMFYFAFPFLLYAWATRMHWLNTRTRLIALFFVLWVFGILPHIFYILLNPDHLAAPADRYSSTHLLRFLKYTPPPYVCTFLAGVTLAKLHPLLPFNPRQRLGVAILALTLLGLFFYTGAVKHVPYLMMHGGLLVPLFSLLTLGLAGPNLISSIFSARPLVLLGEATFALYLLHFNVFILIHAYHLPERLHLAAWDPWLSYVALLILAYAAFRLVENPSRKAIIRRFSRKPKPAVTPV